MAGSSWAAIAGTPVVLAIAAYIGSAALAATPRTQSDSSATLSAVQSRVAGNVSVASEFVTPVSLIYISGMDCKPP